MVIYIVGHNKRSKTIELDLTTDEVIWGVKYRSPGVLGKILRIYKHKLGLTKDIPISGLRFDKKPEPDSRNTSRPKDDDHLLGACDKDWCNYCRRGDYTKCPNR
mgnify:FL=1